MSHAAVRFTPAQLAEAYDATGWIDEAPVDPCPNCGQAPDHDPSECTAALRSLAASLRIARLVDRLDEGDWDSVADILSSVEQYLDDRYDPRSLRDKLTLATLRREMAKEAA